MKYNFLILLACAALLVGCAIPSGLPQVAEPLTPTPDATYRKSRPSISEKWQFSLPRVEVQKLSNGLHVAAVKRPGSGTLGIYLVNREAGDPWYAAQPGLASLMNRTLLEGSFLPDGSRGRHLGIPESKVSVHSGGFASMLDISALSGALDSGLRSLAWTAKNPSFSEVAIRSEEADSFFEQKYESESLNRALVESLYAQVVGENHWLAKGHRKIPKYQVSDVKREYQRLYSPQFCLVLVVGDFENDADVFRNVESLFGDWKSKTTTFPSRKRKRAYTSRLRDDWKRERSVEFGLVDGLDDAQLLMLLPGVSPGQQAEAAYLLALAHLQSFRPGGIGDQLREQTQSIYGMLAERHIHPAGAETLIWVPVQPSQATDAALQVISSLEQLGKEGLSSAQLSALKSETLTQIAGSLQNNAGIAVQVAHGFVYEGSKPLAQVLQREIQLIKAVTPADIKRVAKSVLAPNRAAILIAGPGEAARGINRL